VRLGRSFSSISFVPNRVGQGRARHHPPPADTSLAHMQSFRWLHRSPVAPRTGWHPMQSPRFSGGYIGGVPPVPIPNTAVKPSRADGTARFPCGRVGRCRNFPLTPRRAMSARGASLFGRHARATPADWRGISDPSGNLSPIKSALQINRRARQARRGGNVVSSGLLWVGEAKTARLADFPG
jgi:hypothetical protein